MFTVHISENASCKKFQSQNRPILYLILSGIDIVVHGTRYIFLVGKYQSRNSTQVMMQIGISLSAYFCSSAAIAILKQGICRRLAESHILLGMVISRQAKLNHIIGPWEKGEWNGLVKGDWSNSVDILKPFGSIGLHSVTFSNYHVPNQLHGSSLAPSRLTKKRKGCPAFSSKC